MDRSSHLHYFATVIIKSEVLIDTPYNCIDSYALKYTFHVKLDLRLDEAYDVGVLISFVIPTAYN